MPTVTQLNTVPLATPDSADSVLGFDAQTGKARRFSVSELVSNGGELGAHTVLTTTAHGGVVASTDTRLSDARTPIAHTQASSTITDLTEAVQDIVAALLIAVGGITLTYNDAANTLTIAGFNPAANTTLSGEMMFSDADKPVTLGTPTQQGGPIRGYADAIGSIVTMQPGVVYNGELGWVLQALKLAGGRFDFDPLDGKIELRISGSSTVMNFYNTSAFRNYASFDFSDSGTQTNMSIQHNGSLKRVLVGAADSAGTGFRTLRIAN